MTAGNLATYYFAPALRRGLAGAIAHDADGERATLTVRLHAEAERTGAGDDDDQIDTSVQLYGPGDIVGFDARIVTRTDPRPNVGDFEPNYFPMIEFADPDFPWRYSASAGDDVGVPPWITLIVLEQSEFDEKEYKRNTGSTTDPEVPWIKVLDAGTLPDLEEARRWAHAHLTDTSGLDVGNPETVAATFAARDAAAPEQVVSRLLCARRLKPSTGYDAFVVPTFKLGCVAAGRATAADGDTALTPAWDKEAGGEVQLPYYYRWHFHTGERGDFEYLVRLLVPRRLTDLGLRPMDCSDAGYGMPAVDVAGAVDDADAHVLDLEGALKSIGVEFAAWGKDLPPGDPTPFQERLAADLLNKPYNDLTTPRTLAVPVEGAEVVRNVTVMFMPVTAASAGAALGSVTVHVAWTTTVEASCSLDYGLTDAYGDARASATGTAHEVTISGLARRRRYHFRITATDAAGDASSTGDLTFDTPPFPLPTVVPPIYGRWHAGRLTVDPAGATWVRDEDGEWTRAEGYPWIDELNLDPRHRSAAGFGALVIELQQEALMASVWDQLGQIDDANEMLRRAQLGREAADAIYRRLTALTDGDFLRATQPAHRRVRMGGTTVERALAASPIPAAALDPAFRRIQRVRGPLRKRQGIRPGDGRAADVLNRLNDRSLVAAGPAGRPRGTVGVCDVTTRTPPPQPPEPPAGERGSIGGTVTDQTTGGPLGGVRVTVVELSSSTVTNERGQYAVANVTTGTYRMRFQRLGYSVKDVPNVTVVAGRTTTVNTALSPASIPDIPPPRDGPIDDTPGVRPGSRVTDVGRVVRRTAGSVTPRVASRVAPIARAVAAPAAERFCEEFITCDALDDVLRRKRKQTLEGVTLPPEVTPDEVRDALCGALDGWLKPPEAPGEQAPSGVDLGEVADVLRQALAPRTTIPRRVAKRLAVAADVPPRVDPLDPVIASPEFPQPMYEPLRDISQDLMLPGVERVPQNTLAVLETNGRFVESYMVALNHALTAEMLWREAPVSGRATYFRQFWDVSDYVPAEDEPAQLLAAFLAGKDAATIAAEKERVLERHRSEVGDTSELDDAAVDALAVRLLQEELLAEKLKDIKPIHRWGTTALGSNDNHAPGEGEQLVLLVRGDVLRKYPNTFVYATPAVGSAESRDPGLPEFLPEDDTPPERIFPVFSGTLRPDLYFFGFPFFEHDARGVQDDDGNEPRYDLGVYFVLEERVSETRFGVDEAKRPADAGPHGRPAKITDWDDLTWDHFGSRLRSDLTYDRLLQPGGYIDGIIPRPVDAALLEVWGTSSATIASITAQKPVRIAVHADQMLPKPPDWRREDLSRSTL